MNLQRANTHTISNAIFSNNSLVKWGINSDGGGGFIASWDNQNVVI